MGREVKVIDARGSVVYTVVEQGDTLDSSSTFAFSASQNDKPITLMLQERKPLHVDDSKVFGIQ